MYFTTAKNRYSAELYGKFGHYKVVNEAGRRASHDKENPSYEYASVLYNNCIMEGKGACLDNHIYHTLLRKKSPKPAVYFKQGDWFKVTSKVATNTTSYINTLNVIDSGKAYRHFMLAISVFLSISQQQDSFSLLACIEDLRKSTVSFNTTRLRKYLDHKQQIVNDIANYICLSNELDK